MTQNHIHSGKPVTTDVSPADLTARIHEVKSVRDLGIQENMDPSRATNTAFEQSMILTDGFPHLSENPELGVELSKESSASFPHRQSCLARNRRSDGTAHD